MKSSTVWRKVSLLLCVIILCCFRHGDTACDPFTQCLLIYPDDNIRCSVQELGNSAGSCYGIGSILHSCHCNGEGLTLNLPESNGRDNFTCTTKATWDEEFSKLSCTAKPCDAPVLWDNSLVLIPDQTSYANGTEVTFRCVEGFELSGDTLSVVCNYGNWSSYQYPNCTVKVCPKPNLKDERVIMSPERYSYSNGTKVNFSCPNCYTINGTTEAVCRCGDWEMPQGEPSCHLVKVCPKPNLKDKLVIVSPERDSYSNGTKVSFSCPDCYTINGTTEAVCRCGDWEMPQGEPSCHLVKVCPKPNLKDDRVIMSPERDSHSNGTKVNFSCPLLYIINGTTEAACRCGNWEMPQGEPSCLLDWPLILLLLLLLVTCGFLTAGFFAVVYFKHRYHRTGSMLIKTESTLEVPSDNQQTYISKLNFEMSDPKDGYKNDYSSTLPNDNNETTADVTNDDTLP